MKAAEAESTQTASQTVSTISPSYVLNSIPTTTTSHLGWGFRGFLENLNFRKRRFFCKKIEFSASAKATRRLSAADREAVKIVIEKFATKNLVRFFSNLSQSQISWNFTRCLKMNENFTDSPRGKVDANVDRADRGEERNHRQVADERSQEMAAVLTDTR